MSRPRTPLSRRGPGLMAATTLRVLAAEMSDAGRLTRGRRLRADGAVLDLTVGHGAAIATVQGSRPEPYVVTLDVHPGHRAPTRRELTVRCTCADDAGTGQHACKHVVAALLGLADELLVEPELLARWRRSDQVDERRPDEQPDEVETPDGIVEATPCATAPRHEVAADQVDADVEPVDPPPHPLSALMHAAGALPPLPLLTPLDHPRFPDAMIGQLLAEARRELRHGWG